MIQGLLLAAGKSERFGSQKLLARLPGAGKIVQASAASLRSVVGRIAAVVNPDDLPVISIFKEADIPTISCQQSELGIGHSIACGISHTQQAQGWVIALADMPFIQASTIKSVVTALRNGALIAAPVYGGRRGHPVGFSQKLSVQLQQLQGDIGARDLIKRFHSQVVEIECQDKGIIIDIDTPEDVKRHTGNFNSSVMDSL